MEENLQSNEKLKSVKSRTLSIAAVFVLLVGAIAIATNSKDNKKLATLPKNSTVTRVLGASTEASNATITINKISSTATDPQTPAGMKKIIVNVSVKNNLKTGLVISPNNQIILFDNDNVAYQIEASYTPRKIIGRTLKADETYTDDLYYNIPSQKTYKKLVFQADASSPASILNL